MKGDDGRGSVLQSIAATSVTELLDEVYLEAENRSEIDYWAPLSKIIVESMEARHDNNMTQLELATKMGTQQSVVSRFENMGRVPSYDFIARMANALGHAPGMTLYGDFMAVVPTRLQPIVKNIAIEKKQSTQKVISSILEAAIMRSGNFNPLSATTLPSWPAAYTANTAMDQARPQRVMLSINADGSLMPGQHGAVSPAGAQ